MLKQFYMVECCQGDHSKRMGLKEKERQAGSVRVLGTTNLGASVDRRKLVLKGH